MIFQSVVNRVLDHESQLIKLLDFSELCSKACLTNQTKKLKQKHQQIIGSFARMFQTIIALPFVISRAFIDSAILVLKTNCM